MEGVIGVFGRHDSLSLCRMVHLGLVRTNMKDFTIGANHMTVLHLAVIHQSLPCVKILLVLGSNPLLRDSFGQSSVDVALALREERRDATSTAIAAQVRMSIKSVVPKPLRLPKVQLIDSSLRLFAQTTLVRRALVICVQKFPMQELLNAASDAQLVGSSLTAGGFDVALALNLSTAEISASIAAFVSATPRDSISVIYVACLIDQSKLLGSDLKFAAGVRAAGTDVQELLASVDNKTSEVSQASFIVILDAARPILTLRSRRALSESRLMTPLDASSFRHEQSRTRSRDSASRTCSSSWVPPEAWSLVPGFARPPVPQSPHVAVLVSHTPGQQLPEELFDPMCLVGLGGEGSLLEPLRDELGLTRCTQQSFMSNTSNSLFRKSVADLDHTGRSVTLDSGTIAREAAPPSLFGLTFARELSKRPSSLATNSGPVTVAEVLENTVKVVLMRSDRVQKPWTRIGRDVGGLVVTV